MIGYFQVVLIWASQEAGKLVRAVLLMLGRRWEVCRDDGGAALLEHVRRLRGVCVCARAHMRVSRECWGKEPTSGSRSVQGSRNTGPGVGCLVYRAHSGPKSDFLWRLE